MPDSNYTVTSTTDNFSQFVNNTNTISKNLGATGNLTTTIDSDLVGATNELDSDIGARPHTTLTTTANTITGALNELNAGGGSLSGLTPDSSGKLGGFNSTTERSTTTNALNTLSADIRTLDSDIGSSRAKTTLTTTSKNIVGSINELDAELGDSALDSGLTGMTIRRAINALDSNHDSATTQLRTDIANSFRYTTISGDTGSDTVDSASGSLAIVGDGIIQTTMSGNRLLVDHTVVGATDVDNSGKTYVQDITMDSAGHVTAIGSTAISGLDNNDIAAGAAINAEKIHDGTVSNTEFGHLNGVTSAIQTQFNAISFDSAGLQGQINGLDTAKTTLTAVFSMIYPVGSIYINAGVSTSPATLMGFGTWVRYGEGRVLVSQDGSDTAFDTLGETGGSKTHTLTTSELPSHSHNIDTEYYPQIEYYGGAEVNVLAFRNNTSPDGADATTASATTGSGTAHNILQPYIVVYMWRRTA